MIKSYLDLPNKNPLLESNPEQILVPSEFWPSDHFSLVYTILLECPQGTRELVIDNKKLNFKPKLSNEKEEIALFQRQEEIK